MKAQTVNSPKAVSVSGLWSVRLDDDDRGLREGWQHEPGPTPVALPGSVQEHGLGVPPSASAPWVGGLRERFALWDQMHPDIPPQQGDRYHAPNCLTPKRLYTGLAWFSRRIVIPEFMSGRRVVLHLERPHWKTRCWVNGVAVCTTDGTLEADSLSTPHEFVVFETASPGEYLLTLRVDNRIGPVDPGPNAHSVSDHTQTNWNGIVGAMRLESHGRVSIEDVQWYGATDNPRRQTARIRVVHGGSGPTTAELSASIAGVEQRRLSTTLMPGSNDLNLDVVFPDHFDLWNEFHPVLHAVTVELVAGADSDHRSIRLGLRSLTCRGTRIVLNDRPIFLRGTLECCIFPLTGYPPTDVVSWKRIITICKDHGLNHIRFHSYCPPSAAFQAADELGFYLQVECAVWANQGVTVGDGSPLDAWLKAEAMRILRVYGNHPSFMLFAHGNEPSGDRHVPFLAGLVNQLRALDPRRLYTSGAGWPVIPESDFDSNHIPRLHLWGDGLGGYINAKPPATTYDFSAYVAEHPDRPTVSHEIGQWCVFPNLAERSKYTGVLEARNFDLFERVLQKNGLLHLAPSFLQCSGRLQALVYKEEIEAALRTPGFGGFQLLDLHDFPGQGTATVGVLDPFWDSKGYISAAEFRQFCGSIVPLVRLGRRTFTSDQTVTAEVEVSHFGDSDLPAARVVWRLRDVPADPLKSPRTVASGEFPLMFLHRDRLQPVGSLRVDLQSVPAPAELRLEVSIEGTPAVNTWSIWVFPSTVRTAPTNVLRTSDPEEALAAASQGGRVLLTPKHGALRNDPRYPVALGFSPIFWNTAWTDRQAPHTLGLLCDTAHPALRHFPTSAHSDWHWWEMVAFADPVLLGELPVGLHPIVRIIDDWFTSRSLGLLIEVRVGTGRLLLAPIDFETDSADRPASRHLLSCLLDYCASPDFEPQTSITIEAGRRLFG